LKQLFSTYGPVTEAKILMDRVANKPKGCGFVTYAERQSAETAIATLHEKYTLPGSSRALIVRYSSKQLLLDKSDPGPFKLYISNLSRSTTVDEVRAMFEPYGQLVDDVVILKDQVTGGSRGVAFVRYNTRAEAMHAIQSLHEQIRDKDAAHLMQVKFAHTPSEKKALQQTKQLQAAAAAAAAAAASVVGHGGAGAAHHAHPGAAHLGHNGVNAQIGAYYTPPHAYTPGYGHAYNPYAVQHLAAAYGGYGNPHAQLGGTAAGATSHTSTSNPSQQQHHHRTPVAKGPAGANLFCYGIPETYGDAELLAMFSNFGHVINAKVYRDLSTGKSRGFGFVSYDSVASAQAACASMDGFVIGNRKMTVKPKTDNNNQQQPPQQQQHVQMPQQQQQLHNTLTGNGHNGRGRLNRQQQPMQQQQQQPQGTTLTEAQLQQIQAAAAYRQMYQHQTNQQLTQQQVTQSQVGGQRTFGQTY